MRGLNRNLHRCLLSNMRISGRDANKSHKIDESEIDRTLRESQKNDFICPYCEKIINLSLGVLSTGDPLHIPNSMFSPSLDRINCAKGYEYGNCVLAHRGCNIRRGDRDHRTFTNKNSELILTDEEISVIMENNNRIIKNSGIVNEVVKIQSFESTSEYKKHKMENKIDMNDISNITTEQLMSVGETEWTSILERINKAKELRLNKEPAKKDLKDLASKYGFNDVKEFISYTGEVEFSKQTTSFPKYPVGQDTADKCRDAMVKALEMEGLTKGAEFDITEFQEKASFLYNPELKSSSTFKTTFSQAINEGSIKEFVKIPDKGRSMYKYI